MKKTTYILLMLSAFYCVSCDLNRLPETTLSDDLFWKTENDLKGACTRFYNLLEGFSHDTRADDIIGTTSNAISAGTRSIPNTSSDWSDPYVRIFTANNIIEKAQSMTIDVSKRNRWVAEAYFFRAYYYFKLVTKYGDVPLLTRSVADMNDTLLYAKRTSRETVIQQCYKDLDFAAQWLPTRAALPAADWGRATRSAALAMKLRIGLYEGTYSKYHQLGSDYRAHLKVAIDAADLVMKEGHALYPDFQKLFLFDGEGPTNLENVFVKVYGPNGSGTVVHGNARQLENAVSFTRNVLDQFLCSDGLPWSKSPLRPAVEASYNDALTNRDPRVLMTFFKVGDAGYKSAVFKPFNNQGGNGYSIKKGYLDSEWNTNSKETIDKMLIRYAEVLISYAEALYEYNGSITDAQLNSTVNALRTRVGFNVKLTNAFATANNLNILDEIRRERTIEFIDEGLRYDDIIRWKIAENVLPANMIGAKFIQSETPTLRSNLKARLTDASGNLNGLPVYNQIDMYVIELAGNRKFNAARDYLYPVPLNEMSLSGGTVIQNPNWSVQ
jgi:starch-binding outer membrane protein, SusD/RagB family